MKRRTFLQLGGTALAAGLVGAAGRRAVNASATPQLAPRRLIVVFAAGGWDTTYAIEPKDPAHSDSPPGRVRAFGDLDVFVDESRPGVTALFERHAERIAIVRDIATDGVNHSECQRRILTGTREATNPDLAAIVAHRIGAALPVPYLVLGDTSYTGPYAVSAARVGATNQIVSLLADPPPQAESDLLRAYRDASIARARAGRGAEGYNRRRVEDFAESIRRGERLRAMRDKFGVRGEVQGLAGQIPLALDALEQGLSQAVMLDTRLGWDTHVDNHLQGPMHDETFGNVASLVDEMVRRPGLAAGSRMIDDTVLLVCSEMSRGPRQVGDAGHEGKGHWQFTAAMVIGAGVRGGRVFGATTADMWGVTLDPATGIADPAGIQPLYTNFTAGMLRLCGVDPRSHFPDIPAYDAFVA